MRPFGSKGSTFASIGDDNRRVDEENEDELGVLLSSIAFAVEIETAHLSDEGRVVEEEDCIWIRLQES